MGSTANEVHFSGGNAPAPASGHDTDSDLMKGLDDLGGEPREVGTIKDPPKEKAKTKPDPEPEPDKKEAKSKSESDDKPDDTDDLDDFLNPVTEKPAKETKPVPGTAKEPEAPDDKRKVEGMKNVRGELERRKAEVTTLSKSVEAKEKEIAELRTKLAAHDYTQSPEYIEKYDKPLKAAVSHASRELEGVTVYESDGTTRPADYRRDFLPLLNESIPKDQRAKMAHERFGEYYAAEVLSMSREIIKASQMKQEASKEFSERAEQIRTEQQERAIKAREHVRTKFNELRDEMKAETRYKSLFTAGEDSKHAALLDSGEDLVRRAFEPEPGTPQDQIIRDQAAAANRIVAAGVLQRKVKQLEQQIAALEKYRKATPGLGDGSPRNGSVADNPFDALDSYADVGR